MRRFGMLFGLPTYTRPPTIVLILNLVNNFLAFMHGLIPAMVLLSSLLYAFTALSVAVFFYIFHRAQSSPIAGSNSERL